MQKIEEQYILSLYRIVSKYNGSIEEVKNELKKVDFFSWKISVIKAAIRNKFFRFCLTHYYSFGNN